MLDIEVAGAVAPKATIVCVSTSQSGGVVSRSEIPIRRRSVMKVSWSKASRSSISSSMSAAVRRGARSTRKR